MSCGTYRIADVQFAFGKAARRLEALARGRRISDTRPNYLEGLFDVRRALQRPQRGERGGGLRNRGDAFTQESVVLLDDSNMDLEGMGDLLEGWDPPASGALSDSDDDDGEGRGRGGRGRRPRRK